MFEQYVESIVGKAKDVKLADSTTIKIQMPDNMKLLTPYFYFNLIPLPRDY